MKELCDYGCGREAKFTLKNGKKCCENATSKCEAIRRKNSEGLRKAHKQGKTRLFTESDREKSNAKKIQQGIIKNFSKGSPVTGEYLRKYLISHFHIKEACSVCEATQWLGQPIPLEVHHIDGDSNNNELSNLSFICPNCHALTENYRGKNINSGKKKVSDADLKKALKDSTSVRQALIKVGLSPKGANYTRAYKLQLQT